MYLFDTDHLGIVQLGDGPLFAALNAKLSAINRSDLFVPIISFHEQVNGWQAYLRKQRKAERVVFAYEQFEAMVLDFARWQIAPFSLAAANRFAALRKQGVRIGTMDLRIASIALVNDYTVLTRNVVDFEKVPALRIEDWTMPVSGRPR